VREAGENAISVGENAREAGEIATAA